MGIESVIEEMLRKGTSVIACTHCIIGVNLFPGNNNIDNITEGVLNSFDEQVLLNCSV
jgi:hypothetical protein